MPDKTWAELALMFPDMQTCKRLGSVINHGQIVSIYLNYNHCIAESLFPSTTGGEGRGAPLKRQQFAPRDFYSVPHYLLRIWILLVGTASAGCNRVVFHKQLEPDKPEKMQNIKCRNVTLFNV